MHPYALPSAPHKGETEVQLMPLHHVGYGRKELVYVGEVPVNARKAYVGHLIYLVEPLRLALQKGRKGLPDAHFVRPLSWPLHPPLAKIRDKGVKKFSAAIQGRKRKLAHPVYGRIGRQLVQKITTKV